MASVRSSKSGENPAEQRVEGIRAILDSKRIVHSSLRRLAFSLRREYWYRSRLRNHARDGQDLSHWTASGNVCTVDYLAGAAFRRHPTQRSIASKIEQIERICLARMLQMRMTYYQYHRWLAAQRDLLMWCKPKYQLNRKNCSENVSGFSEKSKNMV
jgi:hypothetical protein